MATYPIVTKNQKVIIIDKLDSKLLVCYDAVIRKQGGGGRIWPNPLPEHVGKIAKVFIFDKDALEDPERLVIQIQNQLMAVKHGIKI